MNRRRSLFLIGAAFCIVIIAILVRKSPRRSEEPETAFQETEITETTTEPNTEAYAENTSDTELESETETEETDINTKSEEKHKETESTESEISELIQDNDSPSDGGASNNETKPGGNSSRNKKNKKSKGESKKNSGSGTFIEVSPSGDAVINLGDDEGFSLG